MLAADHVFEDGRQFARLCAEAGAAAEAGEIVAFGVTPDHPATGYGYIHPGAPLAIDPQCGGSSGSWRSPTKRARAPSSRTAICGTRAISFSAPTSCWRSLQRFEPEIAAATAAAVAAREKGSRLRRPRPRLLRQGAQDLDRLCGDGANRKGRGADGRRRLVGRRRVVGGLALESARRQRQQPARTGGGHRFLERAGALRGATDRRHRPRQRGRRRHRRRGAGRRPVPDRQGQEARRAAEGRGQAAKRPSIGAATGRGAIIRASTRARATRSSASSCARAAGCRCRSITIAPSIGSSCAARRRSRSTTR